MDDSAALTRSTIDRIIDQEVSRFGSLPGYDRDDLRQECRIAVAMRLNAEREGAKSYVRNVARDRLVNLLRKQTTLARCPHDAWGRPLMVHPNATEEGPEVLLDLRQVDVEGDAERRQAVGYLHATLERPEWEQLVAVFVDGAEAQLAEDRLGLAQAQFRASAILSQIGYLTPRESEESMVAISKPAPEQMPSCYPDGPSPAGYDPKDSTCHECRDKFSCLPLAIERRLVSIRLDADLEVDAVLDGRMEFLDAIGRMKRRLARKKAKEPILADETTTWEGLKPPKVEEIDVDVMLDDDDLDVDAFEDALANTLDEEARAEPEAPAELAGPPTKKTKKPMKVPKPKPTPNPKSNGVHEPQKPFVRVTTAGTVIFDDVKIGKVKKGRNGWGWWSLDMKHESPAWLNSEEKAVHGLIAWAQKKGGPLAPAAPEVKAAKPNGNGKHEPAAPAPERPKSWPTMASGKPLPMPRTLTHEEMIEQLAEAQSKLGANIMLEVGMGLVPAICALHSVRTLITELGVAAPT